MIMQIGRFTNFPLRIIAVAALLLGGCEDEPAIDESALCPGEAGVGIRVEGRSSPIDVCVSDSAVDALLTSSSRYDVAAQIQLDDGSVVQLRMVFNQRPDAPVTLQLVNSAAEVTNNPGAVFVYYEEVPDGGTPIESSLIAGGKFRLTFNDDKVAAGTMENIRMDMEDVLTGDPAGERQIVEGFFSVSVSPPTISVPLPATTASSR